MKVTPLFFDSTVELILLVCTGLVLLIIVGIGITQRLLLRIGLCNMRRRPGQALLLIGGLTLSSAFITASFVLNDSVQNASQAQLYGSIGNLDETVTGTFTGEQSVSYLSAIRRNEHVQAATGLYESYQTATITSPRTGFSRERLNVVAVPPDFDQVFGPARDNNGQSVRFADLRPGDIYLGATLAQNFSAQVGDRLSLTLSGRSVTGTVRALLGTNITANASDVIFGNSELLVLSLPYYQQVIQQPGAVNTFAISNVHGEEDSPTVSRFLQQLFHVRNPIANGSKSGGMTISSAPTYIARQLHVIRPDLIYYLGTQSFTNGLGTQGSAQFTELAPALTILLVGTGMLLLALLFILLATERRAELGISRALGFQRAHVVQSLLIEAGGYGVVATLLGLLAGIGLVTLELYILSFIPLQTGPKSSATIHLTLVVSLDWHSLLGAFCLSILTTFVVVLSTAIWISRLNIVAAIRNLDEPASRPVPLLRLARMIIWPRQPDSHVLLETGWQALLQRVSALWALLYGLFVRGPLCFLLALLLWRLATLSGQDWLVQISLALLIAASGLLLGWAGRGLLTILKVPSTTLASRLSFSLIGIGWLVYSIQPGGALFALFQPTGNIVGLARLAGSGGLSMNSLSIVLSNLLLVAGAVVLIMANSDVLVALITALASRIRGLAPISRTSLAYPLAYRFRTTMTVSLLGMIVFLIMLVVTLNIGSVLQEDVTMAAGGYHLAVSSSRLPQDFSRQVQANAALRQEIGSIATVHTIGRSSAHPRQLLLPGQRAQDLAAVVAGMSESFFHDTTMPVQARAQGYASDRAVWEAVQTHPGYAVWRYDATIHGIDPNRSGFQPFTVQARDDAGGVHTLKVIGIVSATTAWPYLYVSEQAFTTVYGVSPQPASFTCLIRPQSDVNEEQITRDLMKNFGIRYALQVQSLASTATAASQTNLTIFFGCYLALGLLFGVLALGVIMSRAVVERRQHIGMLRAFGFSRALVMGSFLLEAGFIVTLSLVIGTTLALWSAYRITSASNANFPFPITLIAFILLGCYLVAFAAISLPARQAARIYPCEALRYE